jgi:hypothetical protein
VDHQGELEAIQKLADNLNGDLPLPLVNSEDLKRAYQAVRKLGRLQWEAKAIGLGGVNGAAMMALMMRANLVEELRQRGVLREFEIEGELSNAVFEAAATIAVNKEDLGESFILSGLRTKSPEEVTKIKSEWLAEGYDPEHPRLDAKILAAIQVAIEEAR